MMTEAQWAYLKPYAQARRETKDHYDALGQSSRPKDLREDAEAALAWSRAYDAMITAAEAFNKAIKEMPDA